MKKRTKRTVTVSVCILCVFLLLFTVFAQKVLMLPSLYANSDRLDKESNREVKELVLDSVKDLFSLNGQTDQAMLYATLDPQHIIQCDQEVEITKGLFCLMETSFMQSLTETDNGEFYIIVHTYFPEEYFCHITVKVTDNGYRITSFGLDI